MAQHLHKTSGMMVVMYSTIIAHRQETAIKDAAVHSVKDVQLQHTLHLLMVNGLSTGKMGYIRLTIPAIARLPIVSMIVTVVIHGVFREDTR
jgi:hypothetical protein